MSTWESTLGSPVATVSGEASMYSASPGQDTAVASSIVPNVGDTAGQHSILDSSRHICTKCTASYREKKGLNRHFKDRHLPRNICRLCQRRGRRFEWPAGRIGLFKRHLREDHKIADFSREFLQFATPSPRVPNETESPTPFPPLPVPSPSPPVYVAIPSGHDPFM
jgi:hypothetical protein